MSDYKQQYPARSIPVFITETGELRSLRDFRQDAVDRAAIDLTLALSVAGGDILTDYDGHTAYRHMLMVQYQPAYMAKAVAAAAFLTRTMSCVDRLEPNYEAVRSWLRDDNDYLTEDWTTLTAYEKVDLKRLLTPSEENDYFRTGIPAMHSLAALREAVGCECCQRGMVTR